jgi:hypothetical protein
MLEEAHDKLGFEHLVSVIHLGGLSEEKTKASIRRIATEVLPRIRDRQSLRNAAENVEVS